MKCFICRKRSEYAVCNNCWHYALLQLDKFPNFYHELENELIPGRSGNSERVQGSRDSSPIPVRLETLHLRSGGISVPLTKHETTMRLVRKETRITFRGEEINRITKTCVYIKSHADWAFSEYTEVAELANDIISISNKIQYVLGNKSDEIVIGRCPTQDEDGKACNTKLKISPQSIDRTAEIKCRVCETVWKSEQWRLLGRVLDAQH